MTVFNLSKQDKFTLFGELNEREVLGFCGQDTTKVYATRTEATQQTKESNIFIVDTKGNVIDIEDIDTYTRI